MKPVVHCDVARTPADVLGRLERLGVATLHEAMGRFGLMKPYMRPIYSDAIAGAAVTVLAQPGDNMMIHVAAEVCQPGDVLVVGVTSENTDGMFGELLATSLRARGVKGLVIDAGCRDVRALTEMKFPVWSRAVSARGTVKATLGAVNVPIVCAGEYVRPGDAVVADDDGIVVVPREQATAVADAGDARMQKEEKTRARLASGELGLDIYGMRQKLAELGLEYIGSPVPSRHR